MKILIFKFLTMIIMNTKVISFITLISLSLLSFSQSINTNLIGCSKYNKQSYNDPLSNVDYSIYKTFSLVSTNQLVKELEPTLLEKQLEFSLSGYIYLFTGLTYISIDDSIKPDILFVYDYSNEIKDVYVAPKSYVLPYWNSGTTTTTNITNSGTNSFNTYGDLNVTGDIISSNTSTITSTTSGQWTTRHISKPGYTESRFFPYLSIVSYDTDNNKKIWEAQGSGESNNPDFRLAAQYIITDLCNLLPFDAKVIDENKGFFGISFAQLNSDGQNFYPLITNVTTKSPAYKSGLKLKDIILYVNDISTRNMLLWKIYDLFYCSPGTEINLIIERDGKQLRKSIVSIERPK